MMHMNETWMSTDEYQVKGWMKRWKGEGKFWGMATTYEFYNKILLVA